MIRFRSAFTLAVGAVAGALCLLALPHLGVAHAQAVADPVATSAASVDVLLSVALTFGPLWGGMAIGFAVLSTLLKRNESTHWIAQGRTLAVITAAVGLGIAALQAHFGGAPWGGVLMTLVLGIFKLIDPATVVPPSVTTKPVPVTGAATVALLAIALGSGALSAVAATPRNPGRTAALRELLEPKDAAARAVAAVP